WRPVFGNEACVLFERGARADRVLAGDDPSLRALARFVVQSAALERSGGVYRSASGLRFRCPRGASDIGAVEEAAAYFRRLPPLGPASTVLDLGAHIGGFAVPAAAKAGRVLACEPDPESRALLFENAAL